MTIWLVPIEPFDERYSSQWIKWFSEVFQSYELDFRFVHGDKPLTTKIKEGSFLDICGTNFYKASQLQKICKLLYTNEIKDSDTIFFFDLWFPGIEMLAYIKDGRQANFKIVGCLHAGTYDPHDFLTKQNMARWAQPLENSWFQLVDKVFVATNYHKDLILSCRKINKDKISVTGFPIYHNNGAPNWADKEKIIIFPHRLDSEKQPELFDKLAADCIDSGWRFIKTKDYWDNDKERYYDILGKARISVSFALQETWGIAMQESLFAGCFPLVPNRLSYREMYYKEFRYRSYNDLITKIRFLMCFGNPKSLSLMTNRQYLLNLGKQAIHNMIKEII